MDSRCYHCELALPPSESFSTQVLGEERFFCCPGCLAIAETICQNGLDQFYKYRSEKNNKAEEVLPQEILEMEALDDTDVLSTITTNQNGFKSIELGIEGITCAACAWLIRKQIGARTEVRDIQVNTTTRRAHLKFDDKAQLSPILKNIRALGYRAYPFTEDQQEQSIQKEDKAFIRRLIVAGLAMMQVMMFATGLYIGDYQDISEEHAYFLHWVSGLLATPVVVYAAFPFFKSAWNGLKSFHFGMNLPVSIAILSGYSASIFSLLTHGHVYYFDSVVMFTFFLLVGRYLEHRTRLKAILKQQNFKRLLPLSVTRQLSDGAVETIAIHSIKPKDLIVINAGAVVPIDGKLISNQAEINEAVITGEFLPIAKQKQDDLFSGSSNNGASFIMQATSSIENCRLQQLIQLQQDSENITTSRVNLADKIASWYVVALLVISTAAGIVWWHTQPDKVFPVILSLLVVSCPCALSLATPAAVAAAIAKLTDNGLMIKSKSLLSQLAKVTSIYFDKTGTITLGQMQLIDTKLHANVSKEFCMQMAASLESISSHPIAHAFEHLDLKLLNIENGQEIIAGGVTGEYKDKTYKIGKRQFVDPNNQHGLTLEYGSKTKQAANIAVFLTKDDLPLASFYLADTINPSANQAISLLRQDNFNITLLSGDSQLATKNVADELTIKNVIANATPESKLESIKSNKVEGNTVLMVGDGVNDIGALGEADASITMGAASYLSKASSNAVLVSHDLKTIAESIHTAKKLDRIIKQNLSWAVTYNLFAIPFAAAGMVPAWLAAIGMTSSSLIVVLNALRLRN